MFRLVACMCALVCCRSADREYLAREAEVLDKMSAIFERDGTDCTRIAGDLSKLFNDYSDMFSASKQYEQRARSHRRTTDDESRVRQLETSMGPALAACKDDRAFAAVVTLAALRLE
jgi:hypothetical protein